MTQSFPLFLKRVQAREEQEWNESRLHHKVHQPAFHFWTYAEPAVVLGCSAGNNTAGYPLPGIDILVRRSGGGAVLAGPWMLSTSVALPPEHPLAGQGALACYHWLSQCYVSAMSELGVDARAVSPAELRQGHQPATFDKEIEWACFGGLSPWEVLARGRKIAGLAQVRRRNGVLLVGGILLEPPDWSLLCRKLDRPETDANTLRRYTASVLQEIGYAPSPQALATALMNLMQPALFPSQGQRFRPDPLMEPA